jgi:hypothetical protein
MVAFNELGAVCSQRNWDNTGSERLEVESIIEYLRCR